MAVQKLQVADGAGAVQERVGRVRRVEGRGCACNGERVGERGPERGCGEMESDHGDPGSVEGSGGCRGDLGAGGGEYEGERLGQGRGACGREVIVD